MRQVALISTALVFALSACGQREESEPTPEPTEAGTPDEAVDTEPVSILRPDIDEAVEVPLEALEVTIGFPDGGAELDAAAIAKLEELLQSRQQREDVPIIIGGHSDAGGNDAVNQRVSQERADAVKEWMIGKGVKASRITTIAFGEQNPIEPNALPNGEPNEAGRAANRRVVVRLDVPEGTLVKPDPDATPTPVATPKE